MRVLRCPLHRRPLRQEENLYHRIVPVLPRVHHHHSFDCDVFEAAVHGQPEH